MKNIWIMILLVLGFFCQKVDAVAKTKAGELGLGIELGEPSGINMKYWFNYENAWDLEIGGLGYYGGLEAHADYLWQRYGVFGSLHEDLGKRMPLYYGFGAIAASNGFGGARGVIGVTYLFEQPFDAFFELAPVVGLFPVAGLGVEASLGARFYFQQ